MSRQSDGGLFAVARGGTLDRGINRSWEHCECVRELEYLNA